MKKNKDNDQMPLDAGEEGEIISRLGERVEKAVGMIQELRRERDKLLAQVEELEARVRDQESIDEEHERFRKERGDIRDRIESILGTLEALEE